MSALFTDDNFYTKLDDANAFYGFCLFVLETHKVIKNPRQYKDLVLLVDDKLKQPMALFYSLDDCLDYLDGLVSAEDFTVEMLNEQRDKSIIVNSAIVG